MQVFNNWYHFAVVVRSFLIWMSCLYLQSVNTAMTAVVVLSVIVLTQSSAMQGMDLKMTLFKVLLMVVHQKESRDFSYRLLNGTVSHVFSKEINRLSHLHSLSIEVTNGLSCFSEQTTSNLS